MSENNMLVWTEGLESTCISKLDGESIYTWSEIADMFGLNMSGDKLRKRAKRKLGGECKNTQQNTIQPDMDVFNKRKVEIKADGSNIITDIIEADLRGMKPEKVLEFYKYDPEEWSLVSAWSDTFGVNRASGTTTQYYKSRVVVTPKAKTINQADVIELVKRSVSSNPLHTKIVPHRKHLEEGHGQLLEINMSDLHIGKYAAEWEVGKSVSTRDVLDSCYDALNEIRIWAEDENDKNPIEKIVLVLSNDFLNIDNVNGTTTKGTKQDSDTAWHEIVACGVDVLVYALDTFSEIANVELFYLPSNHDKALTFTIIYTLSVLYGEHPKVEIDPSPAPRKCVQYGEWMIGYTHESIKPYDRMANIFSHEFKEIFGKTSLREIHVGHEHHAEMMETGGFTIWKIPSSNGHDSWTHANFGGTALSRCQAFLYPKNGQASTIKYFYM